jgi:hypothetical protein
LIVLVAEECLVLLPYCKIILTFSESIWKTDLDWLVPNNDRLVVLSFFTGGSTVALHAEVKKIFLDFSLAACLTMADT